MERGRLRLINLSFVVWINEMRPHANQTAHPMSQGSMGPSVGEAGQYSTARGYSYSWIKHETIL